MRSHRAPGCRTGWTTRSTDESGDSRRIARMYPMIGNRQKLRRKARSVSNFPVSRTENQTPAPIPRIRQTEDESSQQP
jgi:hypothetical protein